MNSKQEYPLPIQKTFSRVFLLCLFLSGIAGGCILAATSTANTGLRILLLLIGIPNILPVLYLMLRLIRIVRSRYTIDRDGLTIHWGSQKMIIPIAEIEWVRPYAQMGYSITFPGLSQLGIFSGKRTSAELGDILFFATRQHDAILVGTSNEVLFLSPNDATSFQKEIREARYLGSITPIERQEIRVESTIRKVTTERGILLPLGVSFILSILLFLLYGFMIITRESFQLGSVTFNPASQFLLVPILSTIINILDVILVIILQRNSDLKPYTKLTAYTGLGMNTILCFSVGLSLLFF